jgi:hypothetical protein
MVEKKATVSFVNKRDKGNIRQLRGLCLEQNCCRHIDPANAPVAIQRDLSHRRKPIIGRPCRLRLILTRQCEWWQLAKARLFLGTGHLAYYK